MKVFNVNTELDEFLTYLSSHVPEVVTGCEWGEHYYCSCITRNFYSFSEWLDYHVGDFRSGSDR